MNLATSATALSAYLDANIPAFLWGAPGVGKSSIVKQIANERGFGLVDFRCSTRDPVALMGLPDLSGETTRWKVPDEFPQVKRDGEEGILLLDELNAAAPSMQAAAFGLVLDRKVGEYTLPKGWRVVAAGNRQSDRAAAQRMPSALANRFAHLDVEPDLDTTTRHFNVIGIDPKLIAFLRFRSSLLHDMKDGMRAFPTPRSWEQVGKVLDHPTAIRLHLVEGLVGEGAAGELEGFLRLYEKLPSIDYVLANPHSAPVPEETGAKFAIATAIGRKVTMESFGNGIAYVGRMPREFSIMMVVDAVRRDVKLSHAPAFTEWCTKNADVMFN